MSGIKRWDIDCMSAQMDEFSDGGYVSLDDHEAEVARLRAELQNAAKAALDATALACEKEREADALRVNAERYRWLRARSWRGNGAYYFTGPSFKHETNLDAAIDAPMGEGK